MIVIVGSPVAEPAGQDIRAGGLPAAIALAAAASGAAVQIVGRLGEDAAGDQVLLALAAAGVGHVAVLREPGRPTPAMAPDAGESPSPDAPALAEALGLDDGEDPSGRPADPAGLSVDAADLELALRYVPDYRVLVLAAELDPGARVEVVAAAAWSGAHLIALISASDAEAAGAGLPADATVLEWPATDPEGAFAAMVAAYAVALDQGSEPAAAFALAQRTRGWAAVAD